MKCSIAGAFVALACLNPTLATPAQEPRAAGNVCGSGVYGELAPILAAYPLAQAYCTAKYPSKCTTKNGKRAAPSTITNKTGSSTTTPKSTSSTGVCRTVTSKSTTAKTSTTADAKASAWSKCQGKGGDVVSTMCSCILDPPKACSTSKTTTATSKSTMSKTSKTSITTSKKSSTIPLTTTAPSTTPATTPSTTSSTASAAHTITAPPCSTDDQDDPDNGGCNSACTCTRRYGTNEFYCSNSFTTENSCDNDDVCPQGDFCSNTNIQCVTGTDPDDPCSSSYSPGTKRSLFAGAEILSHGRMGRRVQRGSLGFDER